MPILPVDRSHESVINDALATLFRERAGLMASSETLHVRARPDIIVRTPDGPVIVEVELEPARTLEADALSRLGTEIDSRKVQVAFAVAVPEVMRTVPQQHLQARFTAINIRWQEWRSDGTSGPKVVGSFAALARSVQQATVPTADLEEAVAALDDGALVPSSNHATDTFNALARATASISDTGRCLFSILDRPHKPNNSRFAQAEYSR